MDLVVQLARWHHHLLFFFLLGCPNLVATTMADQNYCFPGLSLPTRLPEGTKFNATLIGNHPKRNGRLLPFRFPKQQQWM
jgi:hypothetical protein